jgi:hypothetical protein
VVGLRLHIEKILLNGIQNMITYNRRMEKINEAKAKRPYLKILVQLDASKKLELVFLSKTRLESEFVFDSWILLIKSTRTFVCSNALAS